MEQKRLTKYKRSLLIQCKNKIVSTSRTDTSNHELNVTDECEVSFNNDNMECDSSSNESDINIDESFNDPNCDMVCDREMESDCDSISGSESESDESYTESDSESATDFDDSGTENTAAVLILIFF